MSNDFDGNYLFYFSGELWHILGQTYIEAVVGVARFLVVGKVSCGWQGFLW